MRSAIRSGYRCQPLGQHLRFVVLTLVFGCLALGCGSGSEDRYADPQSPSEALRSFQVEDGFRVEVYAAEPHVVDPVEVAFDAQGRGYVVELRDYPYLPTDDTKRSRIRLVEDTDGDGRVDQSTVFADSLSQASSVHPWQGGVIVVAPPRILFLKDTDGDGRADRREVLFTGFFAEDQQSQITNLRFAIDNWIYANNRGRPGKIAFTRRPSADSVNVEGGDFRFRLDTGQFEKASGGGQFGHALTDWGDRFIAHNTVHIRHVVIPQRYLDRNPYLTDRNVLHNINDHGLRIYQISPVQYWRKVRTRRRNKRYREEGLDRTEYLSDHFSSVAGSRIYAGHTFPDAYYGDVFTGDAAANLVHRDVLTRDSASYIASRAPVDQNSEFLASTDTWFRPVNAATGPDGNLYIVDFYRKVIEYPEFVPDDLEKGFDFRDGDTLGRIYRVVPEEDDYPSPNAVNLAEDNGKELVQRLAHPNRWIRLTAQRLLMERQDRLVVPQLRQMASHADRPQTRLHALFVLEALDAVRREDVRDRLTDESPDVRRHAVRLAERFPDLQDDLAALVDGAQPGVAFQLALSLGAYDRRELVEPLAQLASEYASTTWFRTALLSSRWGSSAAIMRQLANQYTFFADPAKSGHAEFLGDLAVIVARRAHPPEVAAFVEMLRVEPALSNVRWQLAAARGLENGLPEDGVSEAVREPLRDEISAWVMRVPDTVRQHIQRIKTRLQ